MQYSAFFSIAAPLGLTTYSPAYPQNPYQEGKQIKRSFGVPGDGQAFDYVVVGGGSAGLTVASRLAEHASPGRSRYRGWRLL